MPVRKPMNHKDRLEEAAVHRAKVIEFIGANNECTSVDIVAGLGLTTHQVHYYLNRLLDSGNLTCNHAERLRRYSLSENKYTTEVYDIDIASQASLPPNVHVYRLLDRKQPAMHKTERRTSAHYGGIQSGMALFTNW